MLGKTRSLVGLVVLLSACGPDTNGSQQSKPETDSVTASLNLIRDSFPDLYEPLSTSYALMVQITLNSLGFRGAPYTGRLDESTRAATREYEAARGLTVTGNPYSNATFKRLTADGKRFGRMFGPNIYNRSFTDATWKNGFVMVEGPWVLHKSDVVAGISLTCNRQRGECILAEAEYGEDESLVPRVDFYNIGSWDSAEIRTRPSDSLCERAVLTVNRVQQSVVLNISTIKRTDACRLLYKDSTAIEDRSYHLATSDDLRNRSMALLAGMLDTLLNTNDSVRQTVGKWRDTEFLSRAFRSRAQ